MSAAGFVRFGFALVLLAVYWIFFSPVVESLIAFDAVGTIVSQQRLDTMNYIVWAFKIAPLMLFLGYAINLIVTALLRSPSGIGLGRELSLIVYTYASLLGLLICCVALGPMVDMIVYEVAGLPEQSLFSPDYLFLPFGWVYSLITLSLIIVFVGVFLVSVRAVDYTQSSGWW